MEEISAPAEHAAALLTPTAAPAGRIVAAVNERESHWFLDTVEPRVAASYGFRYENPGQRGAPPTAEEIVELDPEILITCWSTPRLPDAWLESRASRLRYICHLTGSVRHVVSRRFIERGGLVTNWGGLPSESVAEHALLLALAALRALPRWRTVFADPAIAANHMENLQVATLLGKRVGIHGFGRVARALVRLLAPFGTTIAACAPGVPEEDFSRAGVRRVTGLRELFAGSDVIFECEALTDASRHAVGAAELAALRDDGVLVNVARGGLIDDAALLREAASGRLRIALDVFASEPLPPDSPWLGLPGVVLSPHIAGPTFDQYAGCTLTAFANIRRFLQRRPLEHVVTSEIYDRST